MRHWDPSPGDAFFCPSMFQFPGAGEMATRGQATTKSTSPPRSYPPATPRPRPPFATFASPLTCPFFFLAFDHRAFVSLGPRAIIREATTEAPPPPLKRVVCDSCNIAQPKQRFLFRIGRRKKIMFIFKKARLKKFVGLKPNRSPYIPA